MVPFCYFWNFKILQYILRTEFNLEFHNDAITLTSLINNNNNNQIYLALYGRNFRSAGGRSDQCSVKAWLNKEVLCLDLKTDRESLNYETKYIYFRCLTLQKLAELHHFCNLFTEWPLHTIWTLSGNVYAGNVESINVQSTAALSEVICRERKVKESSNLVYRFSNATGHAILRSTVYKTRWRSGIEMCHIWQLTRNCDTVKLDGNGAAAGAHAKNKGQSHKDNTSPSELFRFLAQENDRSQKIRIRWTGFPWRTHVIDSQCHFQV